jgi:hypothetical protein
MFPDVDLRCCRGRPWVAPVALPTADRSRERCLQCNYRAARGNGEVRLFGLRADYDPEYSDPDVVGRNGYPGLCSAYAARVKRERDGGVAC